MTAINSALIATVDPQSLEAFTVSTVSLLAANTEYSTVLPAGTKSFMIQNRNNGLVKFKHQSAGDYWTLFPGQPYFLHTIKASAAITLYLESTSPSQTVELISWT